MNDQDKKIATSIIGTLVFLLAYMVIKGSGISLLAVSFAKPELQGGGLTAPELGIGVLDIWTTVLNVVSPVAMGYLFVSSKVGAALIALVTNIVGAMRTKSLLAVDTKRFASSTKVSERFDQQSNAHSALEARVNRIETLLLENGASKANKPESPPKPKAVE